MAEYISKETIAEINAKADIVSIVEEYTKLQKRGESYWGCCPFHGEKTPSFYVSETNFQCFGCKEEGTTPQDFLYLLRKYNLKSAGELVN